MLKEPEAVTEALLNIVPTYGPLLIFLSVLLSCLALPIPSSLLVMTAGGFAAGGDLVLWQVITAAWIGFIVGDQLAYRLAHYLGRDGIEKLRSHRRLSRLVTKAEALMEKRGIFAVFLSRTVMSPVGPYVGYLCGALRVSWIKFTGTAIFAAFFWAIAYSYLGYSFATRIAELSALISKVLGIVVIAAGLIAVLVWMLNSWRDAQKDRAST